MERFKFAAISDDVLSDDDVWRLFQGMELKSEEEVVEFVEILQKHRPKLAAALVASPVVEPKRSGSR